MMLFLYLGFCFTVFCVLFGLWGKSSCLSFYLFLAVAFLIFGVTNYFDLGSSLKISIPPRFVESQEFTSQDTKKMLLFSKILNSSTIIEGDAIQEYKDNKTKIFLKQSLFYYFTAMPPEIILEK